MFKLYMTENFSLKVLKTGVLIYGILLNIILKFVICGERIYNFFQNCRKYRY